MSKIRWHCECGQSLRAKPEAAGRRVKCPKCNETITIPKYHRAGKKLAETVTQKSPSTGDLRLAPVESEATAREKPCASCFELMPVDATVCALCGHSVYDAPEDQAATHSSTNNSSTTRSARSDSATRPALDGSLDRSEERTYATEEWGTGKAEESGLSTGTKLLAVVFLNIVITIILVAVAAIRRVKHGGGDILNLNVTLLFIEFLVGGVYFFLSPANEKHRVETGRGKAMLIGTGVLLAVWPAIVFVTHALFLLGTSVKPITGF